MAAYICVVCDTVYDEDKEGVEWADLPDDWVCPVCDSPKSMFKLAEDSSPEAEVVTTASANAGILGMKSGKHHFIHLMLNLRLLMMFALILYFLKPIISLSQNPLFHCSRIPVFQFKSHSKFKIPE